MDKGDIYLYIALKKNSFISWKFWFLSFRYIVVFHNYTKACVRAIFVHHFHVHVIISFRVFLILSYFYEFIILIKLQSLQILLRQEKIKNCIFKLSFSVHFVVVVFSDILDISGWELIVEIYNVIFWIFNKVLLG